MILSSVQFTFSEVPSSAQIRGSYSSVRAFLEQGDKALKQDLPGSQPCVRHVRTARYFSVLYFPNTSRLLVFITNTNLLLLIQIFCCKVNHATNTTLHIVGNYFFRISHILCHTKLLHYKPNFRKS